MLGIRRAGEKETTDNQGQLQASAAIPRGGRTVEGIFFRYKEDQSGVITYLILVTA